MTHWLDTAARGLATGTQTRRQILRRGGAVAAVAMLDGLIRPAHAIAGTTPCPMLPCPPAQLCCSGASCYDPESAECCTNGAVCSFDRGVCCEGRCLATGEFGCCHDRIYLRVGKRCCPEAPRGGTHTCLDDEECCGKSGCCKPGDMCCDGKCINAGRNIGCCDGKTYDRRSAKCCPGHRSAKSEHVCQRDEECCGTFSCCKDDEMCCGEYCINRGGNIGCCDGETYDRRLDKCCPDHRPGVAHTCYRNQECCGDNTCCDKGSVCCGTGASATCCKPGDCRGGVCVGQETCDENFCKPLVTNSGTPYQCCPTSPAWTCYNPENACCINNTAVLMCGTTCCAPRQGECCVGPGGGLVCCG